MKTQIDQAVTNHPTTHPSTIGRPRGRALGFAAGVAFTAVLSAAVGAGAATLVTSAQIKDGTIVGRDVKDSGLTGRDVKAGTLGGQHLKDGSVASADVKDGTIGSSDLSSAVSSQMVYGSIPSGMTVTGIETFDVQANVPGDFSVSVALPGRAHAPLTQDMVNFGGNDSRLLDETTDCSGTKDAPTAPAGKVCLYLVGTAADSSDLRGTNTGGEDSDRSFAVFWQDNATSSPDAFVTFAWAYTAP